MARYNDTLGTVDDVEGLSAGWDWKGEYVNKLASGDGYERFSQGSATPDTTIMFAGPARFTGLAGSTSSLRPIGLIDGLQFNAQAQLQRLFEVGSNRSFFTRGKTISQMAISSMIADKQNLLAALTELSYNHNGVTAGAYKLNANGTKSPGVSDVHLNLDAETFGVPFGILLLFKTKGAEGASSLRGKILGAVYLEYCMMSMWGFQISSQLPMVAENVQVEFDRAVPVDLK